MSKILKEYVREILLEGIYDPGILKAVFMAGGPGSGKTYTAKEIFGVGKDSIANVSSASGLKFVNSDPAFEKFLREEGIDPGELGRISKEDPELSYQLGLEDELGIPPESPRGRAKSLKKKAQTAYTSPAGRLGVIIDGTGRDLTKMKEKKKALEELGYDTYMVFVNTSLEVALERNKKRERKLDSDKVEKMWRDVQENMGAFQGLFGQTNFDIVDNTVYGPIDGKVQKGVNKFINAPIKNPIGKKWIDNELKKKGPEAKLPKRRSGGF